MRRLIILRLKIIKLKLQRLRKIYDLPFSFSLFGQNWRICCFLGYGLELFSVTIGQLLRSIVFYHMGTRTNSMYM